VSAAPRAGREAFGIAAWRPVRSCWAEYEGGQGAGGVAGVVAGGGCDVVVASGFISPMARSRNSHHDSAFHRLVRQLRGGILATLYQIIAQLVLVGHDRAQETLHLAASQSGAGVLSPLKESVVKVGVQIVVATCAQYCTTFACDGNTIEEFRAGTSFPRPALFADPFAPPANGILNNSECLIRE